MKVKHLLSPEQEQFVLSSLMKSEMHTSAEIRVHIEARCSGNVLDRAAIIFAKLGMHQTAQRNGVLIYLAVNDHKVAILGDQGINAQVEEHFWDDVVVAMTRAFRQGEFCTGLILAIEMVGLRLKQFFPYTEGDKNELSDEISYGE
jgi:uncharacterized membrane protein